MKDGDHQAMLCVYYTPCSCNLEVSDLMITDSVNINCTVSHLDDPKVCTSYPTMRAPGLSAWCLPTVGKVGVGLTGLVCSTLGTHG